MFDFDTIVDRSGTDSAKWRKYPDRDIIPMWVADMDFPAPPAVIEALGQRIDHGIFGYGMPLPSLTEAVLSYLERDFDWQVQPNWIVWLPGLITGLNVACRSTGESGSTVLTTVPVYPPCLSAPKLSDRRLKTTPMVRDGGQWRLDMEHISGTITAETHLFLLCNPHNPTGRVLTEQELLSLAEICLDRGVVICSDEIHCDLVLDPHCRHLPLASLSPDIARRTITLMAPSKTYNIPGLSCAFAIVPDDALRRRFKKTMNGIVPHTNVLGMAAAQAAYDHGGSWLKSLLEYLRKNRDLVRQTMDNIDGLEMGPVEATYLAWIDARPFPASNPTEWFEKAGVGLSSGGAFMGDGFVRLNFGCPRPLLVRGLDRMTGAVRNFQRHC